MKVGDLLRGSTEVGSYACRFGNMVKMQLGNEEGLEEEWPYHLDWSVHYFVMLIQKQTACKQAWAQIFVNNFMSKYVSKRKNMDVRNNCFTCDQCLNLFSVLLLTVEQPE